MVYIYILKLKNNKYYIGKSDNVEKRIQEHIDGYASLWTKKYKYISVDKIIPNASPFDENKYTLEYMEKYGINNVRGGIYVTDYLDSNEIDNINKQIWGATNCCTKCGRKEHFVKNCTFTQDINGKYISNIINTCERCGRGGHSIDYCYAKKDINGETLEESDELSQDSNL